MQFRMLGPLEVEDNGRTLALGGHKQRAALALLLVHRNEVVSSDRIIEEIWGDERPETAEKALQVYVSQLRKQLEPERARGAAGSVLVTRPPGYLIRVAPGQLDVDRFEALREEASRALGAGDAAGASAKLASALGEWRGPPLAEFSFDGFAQAEIARLGEARLAALEARIDADLELGRHAELAGELEQLVKEQPLREGLRRRLMLALYRAGRQAEALEAYRAARSVLVDELGIEPSAELQQLNTAMLSQDPALLPATTAPGDGALPASRSFVGREAELATLGSALDRALAGSGGVALIGGDPGIGKSRLAEELAAIARSRGARVLWGRCWEAGGAPAYWAWVQSLRAYVRSCEADELLAQLAWGGPDLAQIVPEIRSVLPDLPAAVASESEGARFRLFEAVQEFLRNAALAQPLVLVLDDLHAADDSSLLLLRFLAQGLGDAPILVVGAHRHVDAPALAETLSELGRQGSTERIDLRGLAPADTERFLELSVGEAAQPELVRVLHSETEGNPLFVTEIVRLLAAEGRLAESSGGGFGRALPVSVREVIALRLRGLSEPARETLLVASVLGREFSLDALGAAAALGGDELTDRLEEAIAAKVVTDVPGAAGRLRFSHVLVRDAIYGELSVPRRARLHRAVGEALERLYAERAEPHLAELAHHFLEAATAGDAAKAADYAHRAGTRASTLLAYEEAARLYSLALDALTSQGAADPAEQCDLLLELADARMRGGDAEAAREACRRAAEIARMHGLAEHIARAGIGYGGRFIWMRAEAAPGMVELLEEGLAALGDADSSLRAELLMRLACAVRSEPSRERRRALGEEAVAIARRLGDVSTIAYAADARWAAVAGPDTAESNLTAAMEVVALAQAAGDKEREFEGREQWLFTAFQLCQAQTMNEQFEACHRMAEELRQPSQRWLVASWRTALALWRGEFGRAEGMIEEARDIGIGALNWNAEVSRTLQLFLLHRAQGRLGEIHDLLSASPERFASPLIHRCVTAHVKAAIGRRDEARAVLGEVLKEELAGTYLDEEWLFAVSLLPEACAAAGDRDQAALSRRLLLPYRSYLAVAAPEGVYGSVARVLGVAATAAGLLDEAAEHFEEAMAAERLMGGRPWLAYTRDDYGRMLLERGRDGDRERARSLLGKAVDEYRALGMDWWAERAEPLLLASA